MRAKSQGRDRVVVGVDGSLASLAALREAIAQARRRVQVVPHSRFASIACSRLLAADVPHQIQHDCLFTNVLS